MNRAGVCLLTAALLLPGLVQPQDGTEPVVVRLLASSSLSQPAEPPRPVFRAPMFAASSVASARRMPIEQREERGFLRNAAAVSRFETEAARIAVSKSSSAKVRSLAAALIRHHSSAGAALQHMLHVRGMAAPMLANDQRKILNRLGKLDGVKFDREFMLKVGLKYQNQDVQMFERAQKVVKDPVLAAWIEQTLPTLKHHLASAELGANGDVKLVKGLLPARPGEAGSR